MSKRKIEPEAVSNAKKQQTSSPIPPTESKPPFDYNGADDEEKLITKQINGKLAVLADQEAYLKRELFIRVDYRANNTYITGTCSSDLRLKELKLQLLGLPPGDFSWTAVAGMFSHLSSTGRRNLLRSISEQIDDRIVFIGGIHSAVMEMFAELQKITGSSHIGSTLRVNQTRWLNISFEYAHSWELHSDYVGFAHVVTNVLKLFH